MSNIVLHRAIELLEKYDWTQKTYARDANGLEVDTWSEEACSFCALGFLGRATYEMGLPYSDGLPETPEMVVAKFVPEAFCNNIAAFNDHPGTTKQDIIDLFKKANEK